MITNRQKAQLVIITTFVLGIIVGASGQYLLTRQSLQPQTGSPKEYLDELTQTMHLDAAQRSKVDEILADTRRQSWDLRTQTRPQFTAIRDASRVRIRALLSAEQQAIFDQFNKEQDIKRDQKLKEEAAKNAK